MLEPDDLGGPLEEGEFDEFNDDTFGVGAEEWEEDQHEQLAMLTEDERKALAQSNDFFANQEEEDQVEEELANGVKQKVDLSTDPAIMSVSHFPPPPPPQTMNVYPPQQPAMPYGMPPPNLHPHLPPAAMVPHGGVHFHQMPTGQGHVPMKTVQDIEQEMQMMQQQRQQQINNYPPHPHHPPPHQQHLHQHHQHQHHQQPQRQRPQFQQHHQHGRHQHGHQQVGKLNNLTKKTILL